jgi:hypothetical protein
VLFLNDLAQAEDAPVVLRPSTSFEPCLWELSVGHCRLQASFLLPREFGFGTARLVRVSYGPFGVDDLKPGDVDAVCGEQVEALCAEAEEARARYYRERASASEHE